MKNSRTRDVLNCIKYELDLAINRDEVRDILEKIDTDYDDFEVEIDGQWFRFIHSNYIWDIYVDSIQELVMDCYIGRGELPNFLAVDWEETAKNVYDADGYGHHFASYDGNEYEYNIDTESYYIFRTN